jgi:very-short-patch-repair endonuclease
MRMRGEQPWKTNRARVLRSAPTQAEFKLWPCLRARKLAGLKFTRQVPIGPWFADIVCRSHKVIVEIDGATHGTPQEIADDAERTRGLEEMGYRIFRVSNRDVYDNLDGVLDGLLAFVGETSA